MTEDQVVALQAAVEIGDAQLVHGEGVEYTAALLDQRTGRALESQHSDRRIDPLIDPMAGR